MDKEIADLDAKGTWVEVDCPNDTYIIPTIWVFTYKFDDEGLLKRAKARLCVLGNKQVLTMAETRAATLAARSFRTLMALVAAFGLEILQYDAINAFVNSLLDEIVYVTQPPGRQKKGKALRLVRALYGLRRSPRLWLLTLTDALRQLGLLSTNEDPCLFVGQGVIALVYVDDIILAFHPDHRKDAEAITMALQKRFEMRYEGDGDVFIRIKIIRDRATQSIYLNSTDYIQKIVHRFHVEDRHAPTPAVRMLEPFNGMAAPEKVKLYQQIIGSINYAAVVTRPDIAKISSHLASFMMNPGPAHFDAAYRVLAYLNHTKKVGLRYSGQHCHSSPTECFITASDAAFGDHQD